MNEYLTQTMTCADCNGSGRDAQMDDEGDYACKTCGGSGAIIDSKIPNLIKTYVPNVNRAILAKLCGEIFEHIAAKLDDSYARGAAESEKERAAAAEQEAVEKSMRKEEQPTNTGLDTPL